jgi:hypothetical protein
MTEYRVYFSYGFNTYKNLKDAEFALTLYLKSWPKARLEVIESYPNGKLGGNDWAFG